MKLPFGESGNDDPYVYPGTDTLINKFGIRDLQQLKIVEAEITVSRIAEIPQIPATLDYEHYKSLHKHVFQDLYVWAGEPRTISMQKGYSNFVEADQLDQKRIEIFDKLKKDNYLKQLPVEEFVDRAAHFIHNLNMLHLFREGNGRIQRLYLKQLAHQAGYSLNLANRPKEELLAAFIQAEDGNTLPLQRQMMIEIMLPKGIEPSVAARLVDRYHAICKINNTEPKPKELKSRKDPNPERTYCNYAKEIIQENGVWPGAIADGVIIEKMLMHKYPKYLVENVVSANSPEVAGREMNSAFQYARQAVKDTAKKLALSKGLSR